MKRAKMYVSAICLSLMISASSVWAAKIDQEKACVNDPNPCQCMTPSSVGGPVSLHKGLLTLRWLGAANIELTYKNQVMLLSTYFDVNPREERVLEPETINQVDYIFLGHGHGDHMSDAAQIAEQTGALVFADPIAYNRLRNLDRLGNPIEGSPYDPVPEEQLRLMANINLERDGAPAEAPPRGVPVVITPDRENYELEREIFTFDGFTVEPIHIYHSGIDDPEGPRGPNSDSFPLLDAYTANAFDDIPLTQEEIDKKNLIRAKGAGDPNITTQGVRALLFTFGEDFTLIYYDSASTVISESIKDAMARIGYTDVALVAYAGGHSNTQVPYTMEAIKVFNPRLFIPEHHDGHWEMPVEPLFQAIRDEMPDTQSLSLQYKEPVCFNVKKHIARKKSPQGDFWRYEMN